ncbi:LLM class flavin-dependent oxidoreductase [Virgibacillus indicus]|uniref:LLM class flavin-dependent oxidoreductase n=1 Tax=Virgibacillus indicus TaxID=2024554 RepID=A0A265N9N0_9BACI|nr:LLM class flavin-dependent oxidoreductase [Virgibacillus indicus]OZU88718.1 LLM class flavin-dependent oxidoreductase [Virgibacillus indicus]
MKLSILDQSPVPAGKTPKESLDATIELAVLAEELGYTRYWTAEHHDMTGLASPSPDIMLALIGAQTKSIRIGSGAVLLPHYKPFNIAERYNMLASLFPGRIDLGLGRAPGGSAEATMALSDNFLQNVKEMPQSLDDLLNFINNSFPEENLFSKIKPEPVPKNSPMPWLLGTSEKSAILASEKGINYAFGHFMTDQDGPSIVRKYKKNSKGKQSLVAVSVICASTTKEAEELALSSQLWKIQQDKVEGGKGIPSIEEAKSYNYTDDEKSKMQKMKDNLIIGTPKEVRVQLEALQEEYQTDEFMLVTITHRFEDRKKSYELLADEFGL